MTSSLDHDHAFRYFLKTVMETLPTIHAGFIKEFPSVAAEDLGIVPVSVQENFVRALFYEHYVAHQWLVMIRPYYPDISLSNRNYVQCVLFCCQTVYDAEGPFYERFLDVFAVVSVFSLVFSLDDKFPYHVYMAPILTVFYERLLREDFYKAGGWTELDQYLRGLNYLDWYYLKDDLFYRNVKKRFVAETDWRKNGKSYNRDIRFISSYEAITDKQCKAMADKVFALDLTVQHELTLECWSVMANTNASKVRGSLLATRRKLQTVNAEDMDQVVPDEEANLQKQVEFETSRLKVVETLFEGIKTQLQQAAEETEALKKFYKP